MMRGGAGLVFLGIGLSLFLAPLPAVAQPPTPHLLSPGTSGVSTPVTYRWEPVAGGLYYFVYVTLFGEEVLAEWYDASVCSATCEATPGFTYPLGEYTWLVMASDGVDLSGYELLTFHVGLPPQGMPTLVSPLTEGVSSNPTYAWTPAGSATSYLLYVADGGGAKVTEFIESSSICDVQSCEAFPDVTLLTGPHAWAVQPRNEVGGGGIPVGGFVVGTPLDVPQQLSPTGAIATSYPTYVWSPVEQATAYELLLAMYDTVQEEWVVINFASVSAELVCDGPTCSHTPWILPAGDFLWWVRAVNESGGGTWSDPVLYEVPPLASTQVSGNIHSATVWTAAQSPYTVTSNVSVYASLTIEPGVQVRFQSGQRLSVFGALYANGTESSPIIFTSASATPAPGDWSGLRFEGLSSPDSVLEHAIVEYAGGATNGGVDINDAAPALRDVTVRESLNNGIFTSGSSASPRFERVLVQGSEDHGLYVNLNVPGFHIEDSRFESNGSGYAISMPENTPWIATGDHVVDQPIELRITANGVNEDVTWWNLGAPYVSGGTIRIGSGATLTIEPGVEVRFPPSTRLDVGAGTSPATLVARGTPTEPITFTRNEAQHWDRIGIDGNATSNTVLDNVIVEYGGTGGNGAIRVLGSAPTITRAVVRQSATHGLFVSNSGAAPRLGALHFEAIAMKAIYNNLGSLVLDARGSWWDHPDGPNSGAGTVGTVLFEPWLTAPLNPRLTATEVFHTKDSFNKLVDRTSFNATLSSPASWFLDVIDPAEPDPLLRVKKQYQGTGTIVSQTWGGEQEGGGSEVPDGSYELRLTATDGATYEVMAPLLATIDVTGGGTNAPVAVIDDPFPGEVLEKDAPVTVSGTASDPNDFVSYTLEYGAGLTPTSWTLIANETTAVTGGTLGTWDTSAIPGSTTTVTLRLTTTDASSSAVDRFAVSFLDITSLSASADVFSPASGSFTPTTTVTGTLSLPADWTLVFKDASGVPVRTFTGGGTSASVAWNGRDEASVIVPDGTYSYTLDAVHASGVTANPKTGNVTVDSTGPTAQITSPTNNDTVSNLVSIVGTASDPEFFAYRLDYALAGGNAYRLIHHSASQNPPGGPVVNGPLAPWNTNDYSDHFPLFLGTGNEAYDIRLTVFDTAGNQAEHTVTVNVENLYINNVSRDLAVIDPASDTTTVSFSLSEAASNVTVRWVPEASPFKEPPDPTPEPDAVRTIALGPLAAGDHTTEWDGRDDLGEPVEEEAYIYVIEATTGSGLFDKFNQFHYNKFTNPTPKHFLVSDGTYSPLENHFIRQTFNVAGGPARGSFWVEFKDSGGGTHQVFPVRHVLFADGLNEVVWDGRDATGAVATDVTEVTYLITGFDTACNPCSLGDVTLLYGVKNNYVEVRGTKPEIDAVSIDANPYLVVLSYGQITELGYTLGEAADVTVTVSDPNGNHVKTLVLQEPQSAGPHEVIWDGTTTAGGAPNSSGNYTFTVTATDPVSGHSTSRKGNITVRR